MSKIPPMTSRQAKAAYRARGYPTMTEKEKRQLARAMELDQRAEFIKEKDCQAALRKKEAEEASRAKKEEKPILGRDRVCDQYGHLTNQYHLGAFFGQTKRKNVADTSGEPKSKNPKPQKCTAVKRNPDETSYDDSDLEDEVLLEALNQAEGELSTPGNKTAEPKQPTQPKYKLL
ncbi:hypothetical protein K470DRAFT_268854 [Piedraia hortae CBS 480.64]|uniref:Uncharacterized protein n=1 Tax=Piedraia hortae CBS 480.64 TaxID=1314780 RepID=A0A6A7C4V9_9PEZI|nr:hypothetical protein K470DRAFT_268854 [Piedraia hortae CBS 480.64]